MDIKALVRRLHAPSSAAALPGTTVRRHGLWTSDVTDLLVSARGKTRREIEELIARAFPNRTFRNASARSSSN